VTAIADLRSEDVTVREACEALGIQRANYYRWRQPKAASEASIRPSPPRTLAPEERQKVLDLLHDAAFVDRSPTEVYATLLEQGQYLCSSRTMYRILADARVARVIFRAFRVRYHRAHVGRLLHSLGWSVQKPERRALERNEERIEHWKRETWPHIKKKPRGWAPTSSSSTSRGSS